MTTHPAEMNIADRHRHVVGHFCSGVTIVTAMDGASPVGLTCQSFVSLSLDPPLVGFSPSKASTSYPAIRRAAGFCINVLAEDQGTLCRDFGRSGPNKWLGVEWRHAPSGAPILEGALAWIDCTFEAEHEVGDHYFTVGRVKALDAEDRRPLVYFRSGFEALVAKLEETAAS